MFIWIKKSTLIYGWIVAAHQVGAGVSVYGGDVIFIIFGLYQWAFILAGSMCVLASLFVIMLKKHQQKLEVM